MCWRRAARLCLLAVRRDHRHDQPSPLAAARPSWWWEPRHGFYPPGLRGRAKRSRAVPGSDVELAEILGPQVLEPLLELLGGQFHLIEPRLRLGGGDRVLAVVLDDRGQ